MIKQAKSLEKQIYIRQEIQMNDQERKCALRREVKTLRQGLSKDELERMSGVITEKIGRLEQFARARTVFLYMDLAGEVQMRGLIRQCLKEGKKMAIPRVEGKAMRFYRLCAQCTDENGNGGRTYNVPDCSVSSPDRSFSSSDRFVRSPGISISSSDRGTVNLFHVVRGKMGILEPDPAFCPCMDEEEDALMIIPGVAFDRARNRIGYGGGYYDRYLSIHREHPTVAAAFECQLFDAVPCDRHDIRPQCLITERACFGFGD